MPQRLGTAALRAGASRRRQREQGQARPGAAEWAAAGQATGFLTGPSGAGGEEDTTETSDAGRATWPRETRQSGSGGERRAQLWPHRG